MHGSVYIYLQYDFRVHTYQSILIVANYSCELKFYESDFIVLFLRENNFVVYIKTIITSHLVAIYLV